MEEYSNEKYQKLENVEDLFKRINCYGNKYNICFGSSISTSALSATLLAMGGTIGGLTDYKRQKNKLTGFIVNKNEKAICLIPLVLDDKGIMQIDINNYINIKTEDIESVKIKSIDFKWKKVTITLADKTEYAINVAKKIKGFSYHKDNFKRFMDIYS